MRNTVTNFPKKEAELSDDLVVCDVSDISNLCVESLEKENGDCGMAKKERKMVLLSKLLRHRTKIKHCIDMDKEFGKPKKRPIEGLRLKEGFEYI